MLACPSCHGDLALSTEQHGPEIEEGLLICTGCGRQFPIRDSIAHFIKPEELTGPNRRFARLYDRASAIYLPLSLAAQVLLAPFGISRRSLVERLGPVKGRVLEVSIGPGPNLPYLFKIPGVDEVAGLDISLGQLKHCRRYSRRHGWAVDLFLGQAEHLPFDDASFDGVLHFGGINFMNDRGSAIREMVRVARPGAKIVISDENEGLARVYERILPGFMRALDNRREPVKAPVDLVPPEMEDVRLEMLWHGAVYCLHFRTPQTPSTSTRARAAVVPGLDTLASVDRVSV
jgi:ubiquinone/menaquinone biosynthesis C-methylase UbiE